MFTHIFIICSAHSTELSAASKSLQKNKNLTKKRPLAKDEMRGLLILGGEKMFLRVILSDLSANDADYFLRELTKRGAEGKIVFGGAFAQSVVVTQKGTLEELLETASVAFHATAFRVELSG